MSAGAFIRRTQMAAILLLAGCASHWAGVPPPSRRTVPAWAVERPVVCTFSLERIEDRREYPELWRGVDGAIDGDGLNEWLGSSLRAIPGYADHDASASIRVDILKAYVDRLGVVLRTNLVVHVHVRNGERQVADKVYRGSDESSPLVGGERTIQAGFDRAMGVLVLQIAGDVRQWCGGDVPLP